MSDEVQEICARVAESENGEWHVVHHNHGFREIFSTEEEAQQAKRHGSSVTRVVKQQVEFQYVEDEC